MKITSQMKKLFKEIKAEQIKYHIKGEQVKYTLKVEYETKAGNSVSYIALRDDSERGLTYKIHKITISIAKGFKDDYLGHTDNFGREVVWFITLTEDGLERIAID